MLTSYINIYIETGIFICKIVLKHSTELIIRTKKINKA